MASWLIMTWFLQDVERLNILYSAIQKQPPEVVYIKVVLKNFVNIHMKVPVLESFFNKLAGFQALL